MIDKTFAASSFLAFRFIANNEVNFSEGVKRAPIMNPPEVEKILVKTADDIDVAMATSIDNLKGKKLGCLLSGGMDSAICASYMTGCDAYTFRFLGGQFQADELKRAETFADYYKLNLHYVDISWETVEAHLDAVMKTKGAPVHSIEPQLMQAALQAKADGIEILIFGDGADYAFYGMDGLLSRDWSFEDYVLRSSYIMPEDVLINPVDIRCIYEPYRINGDKIDFLKFYDEIVTWESYASYNNAFATAEIEAFDPYEQLKMAEKVDLERIRRGESKYLIRELFKKRYPTLPLPEKNPMPRPVDAYFANWEGPKHPIFKSNIDMSKYSGNQKWLMWCLERYLNNIDKQ